LLVAASSVATASATGADISPRTPMLASGAADGDAGISGVAGIAPSGCAGSATGKHVVAVVTATPTKRNLRSAAMASAPLRTSCCRQA
jgi:hypothetical protein